MDRRVAQRPPHTPLSVEDARILALEAGPIRGHTLKVLLLEGAEDPLSVEAVRRQVAERLSQEPGWRRRLVGDASAASGWAWQTDAYVDAAHHVEAVGGGAVDEAGLCAIVADTMTAPLDRDRPLWGVQVVPRLLDGRSAVLWKVHHCLADGMSVMRAGPRLLWDEEQTTPPSRLRPPSSPGATSQVSAGARVARVVGYRGLLLREFRRVWGDPPFAGEVGPDRVAAWTRCDLGLLRDVGRAVTPSATVNDVLLAAVTGGLRGWLLAQGRPLSEVKAEVPVSMHPGPGADEGEGNRDSFLLLRLPVAEPDAVSRLAATARATRRRKNRYDARAIYALRTSLAHAPAPVQRRLQHLVQGPHEYTVSVSNVPGPRGQVTMLGRRVEALYSFAEIAPHHGLRIAAASLQGGFFLGLLADPRMVPDLDLLARGVGAEVEVLRGRLLGRGAQSGATRRG